MNRKYPNLEAEMARNGVECKDLAKSLNVRLATIYDKLNGKSPLNLDEATKIKSTFFPNSTMDYLFDRKTAVA